MKELLEKFNYNLVRLKKLPDTRDLYRSKVKREEKELESLKDRIDLIQDSRVAYQTTIDEFYKESIGQLESLINCALKTIFTDRHYRIQISLSGDDKKEKSFSFDVVNEKIGELEDLKDGSGNGIRAVISFVVLSYYLMRFNSPYIFADECYSAISEAYIPGFFEFVHKLCDEQGLVFILITHDPRMIGYADQIIHVSEGRITIHQDFNENTVEQLVKQTEEYNHEN